MLLRQRLQDLHSLAPADTAAEDQGVLCGFAFQLLQADGRSKKVAAKASGPHGQELEQRQTCAKACKHDVTSWAHQAVSRTATLAQVMCQAGTRNGSTAGGHKCKASRPCS